MFRKLNNKLRPADELSPEEVASGLKLLLRTGLATQAFVTFTGGTFLVAFALGLGASNFVIGLLAAIPPLAQLLQVPSIYLVERLRNRRLLSVVSTAFTRLLWLPIAFLVPIFAPKTALIFLVAFMILQSALGALSGASWNSWMRDLVPQEKLGSFFSYRMMISSLLGALLSLLGGYFVDRWEHQFPGSPLLAYSILFCIAVIPGVYGVSILARVPEPKMPPTSRHNFLILLSEPFRDENFRVLIVYLAVWNFAVNLAAPFFTVQMLKYLKLPISMVVLFGAVSQFTHLLSLRRWGALSDKYSNKTILQVASPVFLICILGWTFTAPLETSTTTIPLLVILHVVMGIMTAGTAVASGNIGLKLTPRGQAASFMGALSAANAIAAGIAPIVGGLFADFFNVSELIITLQWRSSGTPELEFQAFDLHGWDFFFFFAFIAGLISLHWLTQIKEVGEVKEDVVVQEIITQIRREMRNLSTIGGLRRVVSFPIDMLAEFKKHIF